MTLVHKAANIHKHSDGLSRWALTNKPENPAYVPTEFLEEVKDSYTLYKNCHILTSQLDKDCIDAALANSLDHIWKTSYDNGRFHLIEGILYSRSKHTCVMVLFLDKVRHNANQIMNDAFEYAKQKWDKGHKTPEFKVGDLILVSTLSFNNIKGPKKLKDSFAEPFIIKAFHGTNAVQVELSG
ncbi:hypothetical protein O181_071055 [Austropuccinia psidii MF-1]|uniref:Uncharacterized protein n=1 Tax=Austropuccinia psidii MF-1 TaxID=1389203 RepID=A0A9Q3I9N7_9BASI|nr:hypothetical protein [Austropuccinia psidii MF-1]